MEIGANLQQKRAREIKAIIIEDMDEESAAQAEEQIIRQERHKNKKRFATLCEHKLVNRFENVYEAYDNEDSMSDGVMVEMEKRGQQLILQQKRSLLNVKFGYF